MPPPSLDYRDRLKTIGHTPQTMKTTVKSTPLTPFKSIKQSTEREHQRVITHFDEFILEKCGGRLIIDGKSCKSFSEAAAAGFPSVDTMKDFLQDFINTTTGRNNTKILAGGFRLAWRQLCAQWGRARGDALEKAFLEPYNRMADELYKTLPQSQTVRGITIEAVGVIQSEMLDASLTYTWLDRVSSLTATSVATQTSLRPNSIGIPKGVDPASSGIRFDNFQIIVCPRAGGSGPNMLLAWVKPEWSKTSWSDKFYPVAEAPTIANCSPLWVLAVYFLQGHMSAETFRALFDRKTLLKDRPRRLKWSQLTGRHHVVVGGSKGTTPLSVRNLTDKVGTLSLIAGFERKIVFYDMRHLGAQALREAGKSIEQVCDALGHRPDSSVTRHYSGRGPLYSGSLVLRAAKTGSPDSLAVQRRISESMIKPNPGIPRYLTQAEKDQVRASSKKVTEREAAVEAARQDGDQDELRAAKRSRDKAVASEYGYALRRKQLDWLAGDKKDSPESARPKSKLSDREIEALARLSSAISRSPREGTMDFVEAIIHIDLVQNETRLRQTQKRAMKNRRTTRSASDSSSTSNQEYSDYAAPGDDDDDDGNGEDDENDEEEEEEEEPAGLVTSVPDLGLMDLIL